MSETYYGGSRKKTTPLYVIKQQQRKMKRSYKKGEEIRHMHEKLIEQEGTQADKDLEEKLNAL